MDLQKKVLAGLFHEFSRLEAFARESTLRYDALIVLLWLRDHEKSITGQISSGLCLAPSKTTRCLKELAALGLIVETPDMKDLRKCIFLLSRKGANVSFEVTLKFGKQFIARQIEGYLAVRRSCVAARRAYGIAVTETMARLLMTLLDEEPSLTVNQVCLRTKLSQSRVSMSLKALRKSGLIALETVEFDKRVRTYQLTDQGSNVASLMFSECTSGLFASK